MGKITMTAVLMLSMLTLAGCKKDKKEDTPAPAPPPAPPTYSITGTPTFAATVGGSAVLFKEGEGNIHLISSPLISMSPAVYRSTFRHQSDDVTKASISLGRLTYSGQTPTVEEFMEFFAPGPRAFSTQTSSQGVNISVPPSELSILSSAYATQPSTSNFTITDAIPYDDGSGTTKVKVRATFNCALGGNSSSTLTNGQFVGVFSMN